MSEEVHTSTSGPKIRGEVVLGDLDYDGRTILYIIKGRVQFSLS